MEELAKMDKKLISAKADRERKHRMEWMNTRSTDSKKRKD